MARLGGSRSRKVAAAAVVAGTLLILNRAIPHQVPMGTVFYGILYGSLNGLLAAGLVITYRVSRAINFAYGSMGAVAASAGVSLYLGDHWPWAAAVAAALVVGGLVGVAMGALISWRFASSSRLIVTVATVGAAELLSGIAIYEPRWLHGRSGGAGGQLVIAAFRTGLSSLHRAINPVFFTGNDLVVALVVPAVVLAASWYLLRTDAGRAVRAIADNTARARLLGIPTRRLLLGVWAISGVIAALALTLAAPSQGVPIDPTTGPALLLAPLAAAVVARMESLTTAFLTAVGLGVLEFLVRLNVSEQAVESVVFLGVVVVAVLLQRRPADRVESADESTWSAAGVMRALPGTLRRLPEVRVARVLGCAALGGLALSLPAFLQPGRLDQVSVALVFGLVAISLVVLSGWGGVVSLGQFAIVGVGAIAAGDLMMHLNVDLFLSLAVGGLAGAAIAVVLGLPALRVKGMYLAVTTLAFAVAADEFFFNPSNFTNLMPAAVLRPVLWKRFKLQGEGDLYLLCLAVLLLAVVAVQGIRGARAGRVILASRDNIRVAEAAAVPSTRVRVGAFALSGFIAGVGGGLYVVILGSAGAGTFPSSDSLVVFSMTVIGGIGSIPGALAGAGLIKWLGIVFPKVEVLLTGVGVLVVLTVFPTGLAGAFQAVRDRLLVLVGRLRGVDTSVWSQPTEGPLPDGWGPESALSGAAVSGVTSVSPALLKCRNLCASYGSLQVLFGVDLDVADGEILALLGTNGAGKSTLLKALTGLVASSDGSVIFEGRDITGERTERIARAGLGMMPGGRGVFSSLTTEENLRLATWSLRRDRRAAAQARANALALFPALGGRTSTLAGNLSGGEQQMLSLAMALAVRPRLLCVDELSLGLAPAVVKTLLDAVRHVRDQGTTVVVVEQSVNLALLVAERAVFMEKGRVRFSGPARQLLERPDLLRAVFLGKEPSRNAARSAGFHSGPKVTRRPAASTAARNGQGEPILACQGLAKRFGGITAVAGLDLVVRAREVVGLIGHNGAGKTTLFDLVSGFAAPDEGKILLHGFDITEMPPHERAIGGLGRSFQEARLYPTLTVTETISVALERRIECRSQLAAALRAPASTDSEAQVAREVDAIVEMLGLGAYRDKPTSDLSTGTRRVVELACVLAQRPSLLLLDEPTSGVAQAETESLGPLLRVVAQETGSALLVVEHDMEMIASLADRLVALELGAVIAEGKPREVLRDPRVVASYLGTDATSLRRSGRARAAPRGRRIRATVPTAGEATKAVATNGVPTAGEATNSVPPVTAAAVRTNGSERRPAPARAEKPLPTVAVSAADGSWWQRARRGVGAVGWLPLVLLAGLGAAQNFDASAFGVLAPEIRSAFHLNNAGLDTVTSLTGAIPLLCSVYFGNVGDRGDRIRLSRYSAFIWGITAVLTGLAPVIAVLVVARLAGGIGLLASQTVYPSLISDYYRDAQAEAFTVFLLASGILGLVSSPMDGWVGSTLGWRPAFVVLAVPTFILAAMLGKLRDPGRFGAAEGPLSSGVERPTVRVSFRAIRRIRTLRRTWLGAFFIGAGIVPIATLASTFFKDVYHIGPTERGAIVAVVGIGGMAGLAVAGLISQRLLDLSQQDRLPLVSGVSAAVLGVFASLAGGVPALWASVLALTVAGFGVGGFLPSYVTTVALVTPARLRSQAYGWSLVFYAFGALVVSGFVGVVADAAGQRTALAVLGLLVLVGAGFIWSSARFAPTEVIFPSGDAAGDLEAIAAGADL